ncbi:Aspartyl protease family protein [Camellia lanceoleosa]|uniref:Aspartyl protease family protein n=1 Tax=Camellia lanceoleosa TaxID=1840588 RepID=A0ACC0IWF6_9ERIC|nr:Aspartyl protease family protein [Camellia lanceoleosa]
MNVGTIIDSRTVITRLPPVVYGFLWTTFRKMMKDHTRTNALSIMDTCYNFSNYNTVWIPMISFCFSSNNIEVPIDVSGILYTRSESQSSKKAEKRIRKEREAIISATMDERRNASFRISDECSSSSHVESHGIEEVVDSTQVPKKKTRGASKLKMQNKGKQKCDEIDFNERNQPVGPKSVRLSTLEGI